MFQNTHCFQFLSISILNRNLFNVHKIYKHYLKIYKKVWYLCAIHMIEYSRLTNILYVNTDLAFRFTKLFFKEFACNNIGYINIYERISFR